MQTPAETLHEKAIHCAKDYLKSEAALLEIIIQIDKEKVFRTLGYSSLHSYLTEALHLTDGQAYGFIQVARKSEVVPELKLAIQEGELSISQSRRITSVLTPENQAEWIEKAKHLTQRELEREVATVNPKSVIREKIKPIAEKLSELRCGVTPELERKLRRVQDLESKSLKKSVTLEETLTALADTYLERKDPVKKAERLSSRIKQVKKALPRGQRIPLPASLKHEVNLRDRGQCSFRNKKGIRCNQTRWTELHHKIPLSQGGANSADNLITLCSTHHKFIHGNG